MTPSRERQAGWVVLWTLLLATTLLLAIAAMGDSTLNTDIRFERWVQRAPNPPAYWIARAGNLLGAAGFCLGFAALVAMALIAARHFPAAVFISVAALARVVNGPLKSLFDSPRPNDRFVRIRETADGLGFPSGHAMGAMLCFGAIALVATDVIVERRVRLALQVVCAIAVLVVGFGRIYVGAHWPSDVLGGYLYGALLLTVLQGIAVRFRARPV